MGGESCSKDKKPMKRVLVITRGAWNNDNNTGNTLSNIFASSSDFEFHNLYLRSEDTGEHNYCKSIFRITEGQLLNNILKRRTCGELVNRENNGDRNTREDNAYRLSKRVNFYTLWWARELLWILGRWNNDTFKQYVLSVAPDIVFMPVFGCLYPHKILREVHKLTSAKVVLYHADDNYSLKQFRFSPAYWLFRFRLRYWVRRSVGIASANYSISSLQKEEYQCSFRKEFRLLQKFYDFSVKPVAKNDRHQPIKMVFSGNISSGRWRTLAMIGKALDEINGSNGKSMARLEIYTATELTNRMRRAMLCDSIDFRGFVPSEQIENIQNSADILVHVESFSLKDKLEVRQSFSTKIVDYLSRVRCVFAVGPEDVASIQYLKETDAAYVISSVDEIRDKLEKLLRSETLIEQYAEKAWNVGIKNHSLDRRTQFHNELLMLE